MKDFDKWNLVKKKVDLIENKKRYHVGDIWWCKIGKNVGYEQDGKNSNFERPVLVLKGFNKNLCYIVPLTSKKKDDIFHFNLGYINRKENFAILSQMKSMDTKRFVNKIGYVNREKVLEIKKAIWKLIR